MTNIQNKQHGKPRLTIAIATYNRHQGLLKLLDSLNRMEVDEDIIGSWNVVIVDNSPEFNCRSLLNDQEYNFDYKMCHEPQSGIAFARNKGVSEAGDANYVVFVDDDEYVENDWLMRLVKCQAKYQCAVVQGPVVSVFEWPVKKWYYHFHQRALVNSKRKTGDILSSMATGNAIVAMQALADIEGPFNAITALMGGEDALLGRQLVAKGNKIVWCNEAIAYENVPPQRATLPWCLRRSLQGGNNATFRSLLMKKTKTVLLKRLMISTARFLQGVLLLPLFIFPISTRLRGPCMIAYGVGSFTGLFQHHFEQYKRPDETK